MFSIPDFMLDEFTYVRNVSGSYVNGVWTEGTASTPRTAKGAIQPLNAQELEMLPEGQRKRASLKIYTSTELREVDEISKVKGDIVTVRGSTWEVQRVYKQATPFGHYKCLVTEVTE